MLLHKPQPLPKGDGGVDGGNHDDYRYPVKFNEIRHAENIFLGIYNFAEKQEILVLVGKQPPACSGKDYKAHNPGVYAVEQGHGYQTLFLRSLLAHGCHRQY